MFKHQTRDGAAGDIPGAMSNTTTLSNVKALTDHPAYLAEGVTRIPIPPEMVSWSVPWPAYDQAQQAPYNHSAVLREFAQKGAQGWAADPNAKMMIDRVRSYEAKLPCSPDGEVLNPGGRTGIKEGRGLLGQPGPNFAADPVIFRINPEVNQLQILLIQRKDTGEWAIPGGMVDFGELATQTLKRELSEETGVDVSMDDAIVVYRGYVDDPRNTDRAWMETTVATKLLDFDRAATSTPVAGSDARAARWVAVDDALYDKLYASHGDFVRRSLSELMIHKGAELLPVLDQLR